MKRRTLFTNIKVNLILQIATICSGFIIPQLIIKRYGSDVNGMISSITQFLSYITLLEAGLGGVIKAALYKPLYTKNPQALGGIIKATESFFRKIACVFVIYLIVLACFFEKISHSRFEWIFTFSLVLILGVSILLQYFFGITYQIMLQADQKHWLTSGMQITTLIINVILSIVMINAGFSIHAVKLMTAAVFALRPLCFSLYSKRKYDIDRSVTQDKKALAQRWEGFGHHIAYFIHTNTDIALLTIFTNFAEVSVYSIYLMIVTGVRSLLSAVSSALEPYFGKHIAMEDTDRLVGNFGVYEYFNFLLTTTIFVAASLLIVPFVNIYMSGVADVEYSRHIFACILLAAEGCYCLRSPYSIVVFASGHFKQTRNGAFVEAVINIAISLILIRPFGIIGVAIGTFVSMLFRTSQYAHYLSKNILKISLLNYYKKVITSLLSVVIVYILCGGLKIEPATYGEWLIWGMTITGICSVITILCFSIMFPKETKKYFKVAYKLLRRA